MDIISSIILGVVQGATEFLPVSSSGHLILVREVMGLNIESGLAVDAVLQLATACAILVYFWKDFRVLCLGALSLIRGGVVSDVTRIMIYAIILGTIPAALLGLFLEDYMETTFRHASFVVATLLLGSLLFYIAEKIAKQNTSLTVKKGFAIGLFQALALFPGVSRSGASISGGLILGLSREEAARFSFLLAFPIIAGSGLVKLFELLGNDFDGHTPLFVGALTSFAVGMLAIHVLLRYLRNHTLMVFIWYRIILACIVIIVLI